MMVLLFLGTAWAIDREDALDNAALYATHEWTMTEANEHASCSNDYESDYTAGTYRGLPYDWGGYVTLDEFDAQIAKDYGAGSHSWDGVLSCTTGVDCSGFLSKVWETGHYSTSTFDAVTSDISLVDVKRADAFNDPGSHIVLYTYETDAGDPVFYEAAGSAGKVRLNSSSGWSYLSGYEPIRFDSIADGPETGTETAPHVITAFPYEDFRWTAGAASDEIDSYSCSPSTDESGPEVLYVFEAATAGTLHAVVSDDSSVDVDIHVLTGPSGSDCLARNDVEVELEVGPGEVWLSLDTYVGSQEFPGPYILEATFTGELGEIDTDTVEETDVPETDEPTETGEEETDVSENGVGGPGIRHRFEERGCATTGTASWGWIALLPLLLRTRRRR